jgi:methyl-accepting chemotaxis protein
MSAGTAAEIRLEMVQESVKLALDAAEAAADVTAEFNKVRLDNEKIVGRVTGVYRRVGIIGGSIGGIVLLALLVIAGLHSRSASELSLLTQTNREALVVFAENVNQLNDSTETLQETVKTQDELLELNRQLLTEIGNLREEGPAAFGELVKANEKLSGELAQTAKSLQASMNKTSSQLIKAATSMNKTGQGSARSEAALSAKLSKKIENMLGKQADIQQALRAIIEENKALRRQVEESTRVVKYP